MIPPTCHPLTLRAPGSCGYISSCTELTLTPGGQGPCLSSFMFPKHLVQCPKHNFFKVIETVIRACPPAVSHQSFMETLSRVDCDCIPFCRRENCGSGICPLTRVISREQSSLALSCTRQWLSCGVQDGHSDPGVLNPGSSTH